FTASAENLCRGGAALHLTEDSTEPLRGINASVLGFPNYAEKRAANLGPRVVMALTVALHRPICVRGMPVLDDQAFSRGLHRYAGEWVQAVRGDGFGIAEIICALPPCLPFGVCGHPGRQAAVLHVERFA